MAHPAYADADRHPRVLCDEAHRNWYSTAGEYLPFTRLLATDGYQVIRSRDPLTGDRLGKCDILMIADWKRASRYRGTVPKAELTDAECDAVCDWVKHGGGLLLITDAPPGSGSAGNLARRLGVELSNRLTTDPANFERNESRLVFSREKGLIGDHPITRGATIPKRLGRVQTFGGQSLKGPEGSVAFLRLAETAVYRVDPSNTRVSAAGCAQGLAFTFGEGRVVVLGESTALTATVNTFLGPQRLFRSGMNVPGIDNQQMALNIMHWLSGLLEPREAATKKAG